MLDAYTAKVGSQRRCGGGFAKHTSRRRNHIDEGSRLVHNTSLATASIPASRLLSKRLKTQRTIALPPIPVTALLITPTTHSRRVRSGIVKGLTRAEQGAACPAVPGKRISVRKLRGLQEINHARGGIHDSFTTAIAS